MRIKLFKYICLCGNVVFANKNNLKMACGQSHGGNIKMLCEEQWTVQADDKTKFLKLLMLILLTSLLLCTNAYAQDYKAVAVNQALELAEINQKIETLKNLAYRHDKEIEAFLLTLSDADKRKFIENLGRVH